MREAAAHRSRNGNSRTGIEEVKKVAKEVGYPIMLKALAGGGGKGMRLVRSEEEAETALRLSQSEAYFFW